MNSSRLWMPHNSETVIRCNSRFRSHVKSSLSWSKAGIYLVRGSSIASAVSASARAIQATHPDVSALGLSILYGIVDILIEK